MHLYRELHDLEEPIKVGLIGAGVIGTKLADQIEAVPGMVTAAIADIDPESAVDTYTEAGVSDDVVVMASSTADANTAIMDGYRPIVTDGTVLARTEVDVIVEATGLPNPGARHAFAAIMAEKHVVMVTVEADAVVGPLLAELARRNGVTYSFAYGDQPALIVELVEWARTAGLEVIAAGKGTMFTETYQSATPEDALERWGYDEAFIDEYDPNPKMHNSFMDGTKAAVEMCAVVNATDLGIDVSGLHVPSADRAEIPNKLRPEADGGILTQTGVVEMVSTLRPNGSEIEDDMGGHVFVVTTSNNAHVGKYLAQRSEGANWYASDDGKYQLFYRPYHLPGTETTVSVASAALYNEPTGTLHHREADVVAAAKRDLEPGDEIDGGGGYTVYGYLEEADTVAANDFVPLGLLDGARVIREVEQGRPISYRDVEINEDSFLYHLRRIEEEF